MIFLKGWLCVGWYMVCGTLILWCGCVCLILNGDVCIVGFACGCGCLYCVLQCVAVCCSVLQCLAVSCSVLQCLAQRVERECLHCGLCLHACFYCVLQCLAVSCSVSQCFAVC